MLAGSPIVEAKGGMEGGRRRKSGASVKTLKKMLKKAGLKVSGKKATLTRRAKKAHLKMKGGDVTEVEESGVKKWKSSKTGMTYGTEAEAKKADADGDGDDPMMGSRRSRSRGRSARSGLPRLF